MHDSNSCKFKEKHSKGFTGPHLTLYVNSNTEKIVHKIVNSVINKMNLQYGFSLPCN